MNEPVDQAYAQAIQFFNQREWYAAHDAFEALWHESDGGLRQLLHGLIQISVAEYHLENSNINGSTLLMAEGLNHLTSTSCSEPGFDINELTGVVHDRLSALQSGQPLEGLAVPFLRITPSVSRTINHI